MNRNGWSDTQLMATMAEAIGCISNTNPNDTRTNMKNAGFEQLGNGNFGAAFTRPDIKGYVIKITKGTDNFPAYVYWVMAQEGKVPGLPEYRFPFLSTEGIKSAWSGTEQRQFAVMMPAYDGDTYLVANSSDFNAAEQILQCGYDRDQVDMTLPCAQAAWAMKSFFGNTVSWDMHAGNAMFDPLDGELKITDPFCGELDDDIMTRVTGKPLTAWREPVQEDLFDGHGLGAMATRRWPQPAYACAPIPKLGRGAVVAHVAKPRGFNIPKIANGLRFDPAIMMDLESFGKRFANFGPTRRSMGLKPVMVAGRQATGAELAEIGKRLQGKDLTAMFRAGEKEIRFCFMPSMPPFLKFGALPDQKVEVREARLSLAQAEFLQGQYKVGKLNLDQKNFGKGWQPPILNL